MIDKVFRMYRQICLGRNPICQECISFHKKRGVPLYPPASIWHVGKNFHKDELKIMFVGKPARGAPGSTTKFGYLDTRDTARDLFFSSSWPYWSYTREIAARIYGNTEKAWERIAITNIVKCNNSNTVDFATIEMKENCINRLGVFPREVQILRPRHIVFYTHLSCDEFIAKLQLGQTYKDITSQTTTKSNGMKKMLWWQRDFILNGGVSVRLLRTSHPERQKKDGYITNIVDWIETARVL